MEEAENNGLMADLRKFTWEELKTNGYTEEVLDKIYVEFTTDEDIQNTTGGNYYYYFK